MNPTAYLKLTNEVAEAMRARVRAFEPETEIAGLTYKEIVDGATEKARKIRDDGGTFDVIISTEVKDRAGEIVRQDGWQLADYKNNPIVLWGHDYYSLGIGVCLETYSTTYRGVPALGARGVFYSADINPLAQQVRKMYEFGVKMGVGAGCTTSVGFIPKEFDANDQSVITAAELLEFSFVPVPANQGVGPASGRALTVEEARTLGLDLFAMRAKGLEFAEVKGYVPKDVSEKCAPEDTEWSKPTLSDFTDKAWEDLSDAEISHIAGHYAYSANKPAKAFGDLKLPHHRPSDGAVVWNGVKAAMGALMGARGGVDVDGDRKAVYGHLAAHYKQFEKEPPEFKSLKAAEVGDDCEMPDGSLGVLTSDPKDPDGPLVCAPQDQDKSAPTQSGDEPNDNMSTASFRKAVKAEHSRHEKAIGKAIDEFREKSAGAAASIVQEGNGEDAKAGAVEDMKACLADFRDAVGDEQGAHRAKNMEVFRSFVPPKEKKDFDIQKHLKALRAEHKAYEEKCGKSLDEYAEKTVAGDMHDSDGDEGNAHTDWITEAMGGHMAEHGEAVRKMASAVCEGFEGGGEKTEEKWFRKGAVEEELTENADRQAKWAKLERVYDVFGAFINAYLEDETPVGDFEKLLDEAVALMKGQAAKGILSGVETKGLSLVVFKIGAKLSKETKGKLAEAHDHALKGAEILRELHGDIQPAEPGGDGDSEGDGHDATAGEKDFESFRQTRDLARSLAGTLNTFLSESRKEVRDYYRTGKR